MTFHMVVALFFRLVNFALLIATFVYIYKKYIRGLLEQGVRQEYEALNNLKHRKKDIHGQRTLLEQQLQNDQQLIRELKKKIVAWAGAEKSVAHERAIHKKNFIERLKEQSDFKQLRIAEYMLEKESMPLIIAQARDHLMQKYDDDKSHHYVQSIIDSLSKKSAAS